MRLPRFTLRFLIWLMAAIALVFVFVASQTMRVVGEGGGGFVWFAGSEALAGAGDELAVLLAGQGYAPAEPPQVRGRPDGAWFVRRVSGGQVYVCVIEDARCVGARLFVASSEGPWSSSQTVADECRAINAVLRAWWHAKLSESS